MFRKICLILVLVQGAWNASMDAKRNSKDSGDIVYPGPKKEMKNRNTIPSNLPEQCRGKNYCTIKPPDYPEETFNNMFKGFKIAPAPVLIVPVDIGNRQGDPELKDNCDSTVTYEPLYQVQETGTEKWYTVVQAPKVDYIQSIRLETCSDAGGTCFTIFPEIPSIKTTCEQKYNHWEVLVSDGDKGTKKIKAQLPVCCSCRYKSV